MATSLIAKPEPITPAYNEIKYIYDSTNNGNEGFKYIFDIYDNTATKIAEYRVLPNIDGYGEVDLSRLLQSYVSKDFTPASLGYDPTNSYFEYDVNIGEEYVASYDYTSALTQNGSYVQINLTSQPFTVGDQVVITQDDGGASNPLLEGLFTVLEANTNDFTVNSLWSGVTDANEDGTVKFADNRKTVTRDIVTETGNYVFNGAESFKRFISYTDDRYILDDNKAAFVSNLPYPYHITPEQDVWVNLMINSVSTGLLYFENDNGDVFSRAVTQTDLLSQQLVAGDLGGLTLVSGTAPLVKDNTEYYDVRYVDASITTHSQTYRFTIDRRCKINDYEICFLDRLGSIGSFAFQLRDKLTGTVTKETYSQNIEGSVTSLQWGYDTTAQGNRVIYPSIKEVYELNTNWMSEDMSDYFTELVSSPYTWIKIDDEYYSCIVEDSGYEKERQKNRNLIRKTIKVYLSVQDRVNG